jgi:predicted DsbA family dithiol-disulfide isomerase
MNHTDFAIDVWSDYVCPFCYLELPVLERLQQEYGARLAVAWHPFELRPDPVPTLDPDGPYLHDAWINQVYPLAQQRGMTLRLPPLQPRSRKAFEAAEHARVHGRFESMHRALFKAFFVAGLDIEDTETLLDIADTAGLEMDPLKDMLDAGRYTRRVIEAEEKAHRLGVHAVPLMVLRRGDWPLSDGVRLSGALPYEEVRRQLARVEEGK